MPPYSAPYGGFAGPWGRRLPPAGYSAPIAPSSAPAAAPAAGNSLFSGLDQFRQSNPGVLTAFGASLMGNSDMAPGLQQAAKLQQVNALRGDTAKYLLAKGLADTPEEANILAGNPQLLTLLQKDNSIQNTYQDKLAILKQQGIDPGSPQGQQYLLGITPRAGTEGKAPTVQEFFDKSGRPYKAQWNPDTGAWDPIGGSKLGDTSKRTDAARRAGQLLHVVDPEEKALLGDGTENNPGTYVALGQLGNQVKGGLAGKFGDVTGVDLTGFVTSPAYQQAKDSLTTLVQSYQFSVSGANTPEPELKRILGTLLPRPGQDDATTTQKKQRIKTLVESIRLLASGQLDPNDAPTLDQIVNGDSGGGGGGGGTSGETWTRDANGNPVRAQ